MGYTLDATTISWAKTAEAEMSLSVRFMREAIAEIDKAERFLRIAAEAMKDQPQSEIITAINKDLTDVLDDVSEAQNALHDESRELWEAIQIFEKGGQHDS